MQQYQCFLISMFPCRPYDLIPSVSVKIKLHLISFSHIRRAEEREDSLMVMSVIIKTLLYVVQI